MAYQNLITRLEPACILILADQSASTAEPVGGQLHERKCDQVALAINNWLQMLIVKCSSANGVRDYVNIGVFGFRTDAMANPVIESCLHGPLAEKPIVRISEIEANVARIAEVNQQFYDPDTNELQEIPISIPIWIDPVAEGGTPTCSVFYHAYQVLENWCAEHPKSFPPLVIHISDGESNEGDPTPYAEALKGLGTEDGNVLLFNCQLSMTNADPVIYPATSDGLPDEFAHTMFEMSSELPETLVAHAQTHGIPVQTGSRALVFNGGIEDMISMLNMLDLRHGAPAKHAHNALR